MFGLESSVTFDKLYPFIVNLYTNAGNNRGASSNIANEYRDKTMITIT